MAVAFSVLSWNVEKFGTKGSAHTTRILGKLTQKAPDLVAFYETKPSALWLELMKAMTGYTWHITEGAQTQETLLGVKNDVTAFVTQRTEFKTRDAYYRPGMLCTVLVDNVEYPVLFLHLASFDDAKGFGRRQEQLDAAFEFTETLDKAATGASANYMFVGDLNAMGLDFKYAQSAPGASYDRVRVSPDRELARIEMQASKHGMRVLTKTHEFTWRNESGKKSNLDWAVAANHLLFTQQHGKDVLVEGWVDEPPSQQVQWLHDYSDHSMIFLKVRKV